MSLGDAWDQSNSNSEPVNLQQRKGRDSQAAKADKDGPENLSVQSRTAGESERVAMTVSDMSLSSSKEVVQGDKREAEPERKVQ